PPLDAITNSTMSALNGTKPSPAAQRWNLGSPTRKYGDREVAISGRHPFRSRPHGANCRTNLGSPFANSHKKRHGLRRAFPFETQNYWRSNSTRSPMWTGSIENTIIPVAVFGVVPMIRSSPTARVGISAVRIAGPLVMLKKLPSKDGCRTWVGSIGGALKDSESTGSFAMVS